MKTVIITLVVLISGLALQSAPQAKTGKRYTSIHGYSYVTPSGWGVHHNNTKSHLHYRQKEATIAFLQSGKARSGKDYRGDLKRCASKSSNNASVHKLVSGNTLCQYTGFDPKSKNRYLFSRVYKKDYKRMLRLVLIMYPKDSVTKSMSSYYSLVRTIKFK